MSGGTRSYEMARRWVEAGHQVEIVTTCRDEAASGRGWRTYTVDGIKVHELVLAYSNKMNFWRRVRAFALFAVRAACRARTVGGDIVFATSTPLTIAIPGVFAARRLNVPMVFEVRDLWPELPIAVGALKSRLLIYLAKRLESFAYANAECIVALSPGMADGVRDSGISPAKIAVIPNSCDIDDFQQSGRPADETRTKYKLPADGLIVSYTGTIGEVNGVDYLCKLAFAMKDVDPTVKFLIVGDGKDRERVHQVASETGLLDESIFFIDPVAKKEMPNVLAMSAVCTSLFIDLEEMWNNSANKFFDALAAGKPVAINYGGWQSALLAESGAGIALDPDDISNSARQLAAFLRSDDALDQAAAAAIDLARTKFDREYLAAELLAVLSAAVQDYARRTAQPPTEAPSIRQPKF